MPLDDNISRESIDIYILLMTLACYAPQATAIAFSIQVGRLIQKEGSAVTPAKSEYWGERLVSYCCWMTTKSKESTDIYVLPMTLTYDAPQAAAITFCCKPFAQPRGSTTKKERAIFRRTKVTVQRKEKRVCIEH